MTRRFLINQFPPIGFSPIRKGSPLVFVCLTLLALVALIFPTSPAFAQPSVLGELKGNKSTPKPKPSSGSSAPRSRAPRKVERSAPKIVYVVKEVPVEPAKPKLDPNRPPLEPKPKQLWKNPKDEAELIWIPGGEFVMGSDESDPDARDHEKPQHKVKLDGFWMYRNLVSVAQYERFAKETKRPMPPAPDFNPGWKFKDHPMVNVSWEDAKAYCVWAGAQLPTEAQWEVAARGGSTFRYPWGNTFDESKLWSSLQEARDAKGTAAVFRQSRVSESLFGIRDMAGNVWQWCADWYDPEYYTKTAKENPEGPVSGDARVLRGGSWFNHSQGMFRTTYRLRALPVQREEDRGFRAVMPETLLVAQNPKPDSPKKTESAKAETPKKK